MKRIDLLVIYIISLFFSFSGYLNAQSPTTDRILIEFMKPGDKDAEARDYNILPWPEEAKAAAYKAAEIWASYLEITVPIRVKFGWCNNIQSNSTVAEGGAMYNYQYTNGYYYPLSLINQLLGYDKNIDIADIICVFKSNVNWYFGLEEKQQWYPDPIDPTIEYSKNSIIPTMLHEICHGLGIGGDSFAIINKKGQWGSSVSGKANIYDTFIGDNKGYQLINTSKYSNNSIELANILTSDAVYWLGENGTKANNGERVKIYAPKTWSSSSISHIDIEYSRTINDLMAYGLGGVTSMNGKDNYYTFSPGPIVLGMLQDIGWTLKDVVTANEAIEIDSPVKLFTAGNQITIEGATAGDKVIIVGFSGRLVYSGISNGRSMSIDLTSGMYVVRVGKESFKIKM